MKRPLIAVCLLLGLVAAANSQLIVGTFSGAGTAYATWSPTDLAASLTLSNGNLTVTNTSGSGSISYRTGRATIGKTAGKWYWEVTINDLTNSAGFIGVALSSQSLTNFIGVSGGGWSYQATNGNCNSNGSVAYGTSWTTGDVIGVALNVDAGTVTFYKNGTSLGTIQAAGCTSVTGGTVYPAYTEGRNGHQFTANFGASAFTYSVPSGYNPGVF